MNDNKPLIFAAQFRGEDAKQVADTAKRYGMTRSALVRAAVRQLLDTERRTGELRLNRPVSR